MEAAGKRRPIPPQVVVVIGPPGAGKGTQCSRAASQGMVHLSTGDALRDAIREGTPLGHQVAEEIAGGGLVADGLVLDVVTEAVSTLGPDDVVLLDGFPRTVAQADALVGRLDAPPALVLELTVPLETLRARLAQRVVCSRCGRPGTRKRAGGNLRAVCSCGGTMEHRVDDLPEQLERRLEIFEREHRQVVERLRAAGTPHRVLDGSRPADEVASAFGGALAVHTGRSGQEDPRVRPAPECASPG